MEAFYHLLLDDPNLETVGVGESLGEELTHQLSWDVPSATQQRLDDAITKVRRADPRMEGVKSAIIRAAIRHTV